MRTVCILLVAFAAAVGLVSCIDTGSGNIFGGDSGFFGETGSFCFDSGAGEVRYADFDHDGFGDPDSDLSRCDAPDTWVADNTDCNDAEEGINPSAVEVCGDGVDQDCDGEDPACDE